MIINFSIPCKSKEHIRKMDSEGKCIICKGQIWKMRQYNLDIDVTWY